VLINAETAAFSKALTCAKILAAEISTLTATVFLIVGKNLLYAITVPEVTQHRGLPPAVVVIKKMQRFQRAIRQARLCLVLLFH